MNIIIYSRSWMCTCLFFIKQKTSYEMRISDWSSDVCSSDLLAPTEVLWRHESLYPTRNSSRASFAPTGRVTNTASVSNPEKCASEPARDGGGTFNIPGTESGIKPLQPGAQVPHLHGTDAVANARIGMKLGRSEEHTSELQSLMRISYAVFCLKK